MIGANGQGPDFWSTVWLLLKSARRRFQGRRLRQQQLMNQRAGKNATDWGWLGTALGVLFMVLVHGLAAATLYFSVVTGERIAVEGSGKIVVSRRFLNMMNSMETHLAPLHIPREAVEQNVYDAEAQDIARISGESKEQIAKKLRDAYVSHGTADFVTERSAQPGFRLFARKRWQRLPAMLGSLVVLWWALMLMFQGEGLELDLQRRRHPMWEWLFSHPVPIGAVFLAEMLGPLAANPVYWTAPIFVGAAYGLMYGPGLGLLGAVVIGVPVAVATGCMGKAVEIGVTLRVAPRQRGAVIGLLGWLGYASMMLLFVGMFIAPKLSTIALKWITPLAAIPWPWLGLLFGLRPDGEFSFLLGMATCWIATVLLLATAVWLSVWGTQKGLAGAFGAMDARPAAPKKAVRFGREPLYRKEFLWFMRDRSAIVQSILIPLTVAGVQVFNLRGAMKLAQGEWNYLSGAAIVFGTYFLWVLGPKSLASEGTALWIALTWPRGLESLLKAKAWLWSMISNGLVAVVLVYAAMRFPHEAWKIALVGAAWVLFGRSMAEKSVTLVTVTSESGEVQKLRGGTRAGAQLGMLTFAIGVMTQQWHIAVMGIVYSYITAAAMWQNFRARLPYLYDPWSEVVPDPPTLVHAMIAISVMVELGAVLTAVLMGIFGRNNAPMAQAASYGISAVVISYATMKFMDNRGVSLRDVWVWDQTARKPVAKDGFAPSIYGMSRSFEEMMAEPENVPWWRSFGELDGRFLGTLLMAASLGIALGLVGLGYTALLEHLPWTAEMMRKAQEARQNLPEWRTYSMVMAVGFAPLAEEYLFRGLLFRALDREWGGWKAVLGSAAFFAIYHPPLAWPLVFSVGALNAVLFKKTRRLAPAVVLHMLYNAVVLSR
jgi:Type II CAAX prenyl endopeptidase Rce1-like